MPPKRPANSQSPDGGFVAADEFTRVVRKRLSTSTRTGQACDRCKVRKIRCDGLLNGCSPCLMNRSECKTTDRISQKAVPRGYLENLEAKCMELEARNKELETALMASQATARHANGFAAFEQADWVVNGAKQVAQPQPQQRMVQPGFPPQHDREAERWRVAGEKDPVHQLSDYPPMNSGTAAPRPISSNFRPGSSNTHYLGMSAGKSYLSSMKATALSLLGIDIDLSALDPNEQANRTGYNRTDESYGSCLSTIFNLNPNVPKVDLPPANEGRQYVNYFLVISHPYLPIVHKPTFLQMVERVYTDKTFEPTAAQTAMLHMVFAIVHFQNAANDRMKNRGLATPGSTEIMERSRRHYHYAISLLYELLSGSSLEDLQAIGLILQHLRSFPKPGGSWLLSRVALAMCLELGLHRSAQKWEYNREHPNCIEIELRKRVFWCILTLEVSLASKLGRPMSIREYDFDVEYPERIDDEYILENEILKREDGVNDCTFDIAIEMFKHATLTIQIHSSLYSVARPSRESYVALVESIESKLNKWRDAHPKSLSLDSPAPERRFQAAHLHSWYHEARILMRHPSLAYSPSPEYTADCIRICVESSREILRLTDSLRKGSHYLDTTWYGATVQLLATLTILFSVWNSRETATPAEIAAVKSDMDLAMDIMGDLGALLGSPNRLRDVVQLLTQRTMELLHQSSYPEYTAPPPQQQQYPTDPALESFSYAPTTATTPQMQWGWNGAESWRLYMQNISAVVENLDPSETYASSALIALNQDCQSYATAPAVAAVSQQQQQQQDQGWQGVMGAFTYADSAVRGSDG